MLTEVPPLRTRVIFYSSRSGLDPWNYQAGEVCLNPYNNRSADLPGYCWVVFDNPILGGVHCYNCNLNELDLEKLTDEQQEKRQRQHRAMKFL